MGLAANDVGGVRGPLAAARAGVRTRGRRPRMETLTRASRCVDAGKKPKTFRSVPWFLPPFRPWPNRFSFLSIYRVRRLPQLPHSFPLADFEASLKIDAQRATWIDVSRNDWTAGVRCLRDQWPTPSPAHAVQSAALYLNQLIGSVVPEAMKLVNEGGWTQSEFELWHARLRRVRVCTVHEPVRDDVPQTVSPSTRRVDAAITTRSSLTQRLDAVRTARSSLLSSDERLAALRRDENYQNLVEHYRRGIRSGVVASVDWEQERTRPDPERDVLIQAAVATMVQHDGPNTDRTGRQIVAEPERGTAPTPRSLAAFTPVRRIPGIELDQEPTLASHAYTGRLPPYTIHDETEEEREELSDSVVSSDWDDDVDARRRERELDAPGRPQPQVAPTPDDEPEPESDSGDDSPEALADARRMVRRTRHTIGRERALLQVREQRASRAREEERARAETAATPVTPVRPETAEVVSQFPIIQRLTREFARECPVPPQEYHASSRDDDTTTNPQRTQDYDPRLRPLPPSSPSTAYTTPTDSPEDDRTRGDSRHTDNATRNTDDVDALSEQLRDLMASTNDRIRGFEHRLTQAQTEAETAKDAVTCQICFGAKRDALVMPCCHLLYCHLCVTRATSVAENRGQPVRCPCCRGPISGVLRCRLDA